MGIELGLATPAVPRDPAALDDAYCAWAAGLGVAVLGTHLGPGPEALSAPKARALRECLAAHGLRIVQQSGYNPNMVRPDAEGRRADLARLTLAYGVAADLGCPVVLTGCGSLNPDHFYGPHPENHRPETRERLIAFLREAAPRAEDAGVVHLLEPHLLTALDTPEHIAEVVAAVDSPAVRVNVDPINLLGGVDAVYHSGEEMARIFSILEPYYYPNAHAKDIRIESDFVLQIKEAPCGHGVFDFAAFLRLVGRLGPRVPLLVEHFPADFAPASLALLRATAARVGVALV